MAPPETQEGAFKCTVHWETFREVLGFTIALWPHTLLSADAMDQPLYSLMLWIYVLRNLESMSHL